MSSKGGVLINIVVKLKVTYILSLSKGEKHMFNAISVDEQYFAQVHDGEEPGYDQILIACQSALREQSRVVAEPDLDDFDHAARLIEENLDPLVAKIVIMGIVTCENGCDCFCVACQQYHESVKRESSSKGRRSLEEKFDQTPCLLQGSCPFPVHENSLEEITTYESDK